MDETKAHKATSSKSMPTAETAPRTAQEEARKHRKRTLDALYAQRKRDCQRFEKEKLEETVAGLESHKRLVKEDNERLEALLRHAEAQVVIVKKQELASSTAGTSTGVNATLSHYYQERDEPKPPPNMGHPTQRPQVPPVTNLAARQGNPQDQDVPAVPQEQLLALLGSLLQSNTAPASAGTASLPSAPSSLPPAYLSQLSSLLNQDGQPSAENQAANTPHNQQTPEAALAKAHEHQQQLLQFIKLHLTSSTTPATLTPAFTGSPSPPEGSAYSSVAAASASANAPAPSFQHQPQDPTLPNPNLSQILALGSVIENILRAHCQDSARNQPALQQHQQPSQLQHHQQLQLQQHQQHQHQQQTPPLQQHQQTSAVDLKALASLLDPHTRAALVQWNQIQSTQMCQKSSSELQNPRDPSAVPATGGGAAASMDSLLEQFAAQQRQQHHHQEQHQQQIAPFHLPPMQGSNTAASASYSSDALMRGQLASLQAVMKQQQQQQQQFQQRKWQEEDRQRKRQQKLAEQQQLWLRDQVPHHPQNPQIISEHNLTRTTQTHTTTTPTTTTPSNMTQLLAMVAALQSQQSQSSYPSR